MEKLVKSCGDVSARIGPRNSGGRRGLASSDIDHRAAASIAVVFAGRRRAVRFHTGALAFKEIKLPGEERATVPLLPLPLYAVGQFCRKIVMETFIKDWIRIFEATPPLRHVVQVIAAAIL